MSKSLGAAEVTKSDLRISKAMLQEENNIEDAAAASSRKPELSFQPEIRR